VCKVLIRVQVNKTVTKAEYEVRFTARGLSAEEEHSVSVVGGASAPLAYLK
jgi:uncharacterized membrane protein